MIDNRNYVEVAVRISPFSEENAEIAEAMISDLPYDAFETEESVLKCYIRQPLYDRRALRLVLSELPFDTSFTAAPIPFRNWNAEWEKTFTPIVVGNAVTVKLRDDRQTARTRYNIRLRPEMAFGTGHHETTYMMMESMLESAGRISGAAVMDIGCGTGVLAVLAAKMGADKVCAVDIDAVAAQSASDNVRLNRVSRRVEVRCGDASLLQTGSYDLVLANIHRNIILMDLQTYSRSLRPGGELLLSGFYESDVPDISGEAGRCGLAFSGMKKRGGWVCLRFGKPVR
jgi:ribosomal protein L11 methyltransferase